MSNEQYWLGEEPMARAALAAQRLVSQRHFLAEDVADLIELAGRQWDWAVSATR